MDSSSSSSSTHRTAVAEHTPAGYRGISYGFTYLGIFGIWTLGGAILVYASVFALFAVLAGFATLDAVVPMVLL